MTCWWCRSAARWRGGARNGSSSTSWSRRCTPAQWWSERTSASEPRPRATWPRCGSSVLGTTSAPKGSRSTAARRSGPRRTCATASPRGTSKAPQRHSDGRSPFAVRSSRVTSAGASSATRLPTCRPRAGSRPRPTACTRAGCVGWTHQEGLTPARCPPRSASAPTRPSTVSGSGGWRPTYSTGTTSSCTASRSRCPSWATSAACTVSTPWRSWSQRCTRTWKGPVAYSRPPAPLRPVAENGARERPATALQDRPKWDEAPPVSVTPRCQAFPQASRSCSTSAAILSTAAWSSPDTSTVSPQDAPSVMISSEEPASTGSSPGTDRVTSESSSPAASEMIAAGRACRPTDDPTMTDLDGMSSSSFGGGCLSNANGGELFDLLLALGEGFQEDHAGSRDDGAGHQREEVPQDVGDREQHEDAAVRGPHADVERHGKPASDRAAEHDRRDHTQRVGRGEGDRAFGDEARAEQPGRLAVLPLRGREQPGPDDGGERQGDRGHHAGEHHGGHDLQLRGVGGQRCRTADAGGREAVGDLVQRTAHVERHHQAEDDTEQDRVGAAHIVQTLGELVHQPGDRPAEDDDHEEPGHEAGEQRDDQNRHQAPCPRGHLAAGDPVGDHTREATTHDGAEEPGLRSAELHYV